MTKELEQLIQQYALNKNELDSYEKLCKSENEEIKQRMVEEDLTEAVAGDYVAKYIVQRRESINEAKLLVMLKQLPETEIEGIIKTREYVDFDTLESAIYNGRLPNEFVAQMGALREVKEVPTLKITKARKAK